MKNQNKKAAPDATNSPAASELIRATGSLSPLAVAIADTLMTSFATGDEGVSVDRLTMMKALDSRFLVKEKEMGGLCRSAVISRIETVLEERGLIHSANT